MNVTRSGLETIGLAAALALFGPLLDRPEPLVGAAALGAWLLARQAAFVAAVGRTDDGLAVDQSLDRSELRTDEPAALTLAVRRSTTDLSTTVRATPPVTAESDEVPVAVTLADDETRGDAAAALRWPVAGRYEIERATVSATDPDGLFRQRWRRGPTPSATVGPRTPRNVHVGAGGTEVATAFGEHEGARLGGGVDPAELRQYTPDDPARRIDWKATARLAEPYVREREPRTDRQTVLVVDHRSRLGDGPAGETPLDYLRAVGLGLADAASGRDDPLSLHAVGDEGLTVDLPPATGAEQYDRVREALLALETTAPVDAPGAVSPVRARRVAARLEDDESAFATRLRPFVGAMDPYVRRIDDDPLVATVRSRVRHLGGAGLIVVLTDDRDRARLRETVKAARRGDRHVLAVLAPDALFAPGGLTDVDEAYDEYHSFEVFRRELDRLERVTALEVGPGDRLGAVLAAREARA